jgi:hypothetical protein
MLYWAYWACLALGPLLVFVLLVCSLYKASHCERIMRGSLLLNKWYQWVPDPKALSTKKLQFFLPLTVVTVAFVTIVVTVSTIIHRNLSFPIVFFTSPFLFQPHQHYFFFDHLSFPFFHQNQWLNLQISCNHLFRSSTGITSIGQC